MADLQGPTQTRGTQVCRTWRVQEDSDRLVWGLGASRRGQKKLNVMELADMAVSKAFHVR